MPGRDSCAADRWLTDARFVLVVEDGQRYAVRDQLRYLIEPACREHPTQDRTEQPT